MNDEEKENMKKRLEEAELRLKKQLEDKNNNVFFLLMREIPYIFSNGKTIAGFIENGKSEMNDMPTKDPKLIPQLLNSLHLGERVVQQDHFKKLLDFKINVAEGRSQTILNVPSGLYKISKGNGVDKCVDEITHSMGISVTEKNLIFNNNSIYLFKHSFENFCLYVFFMPYIDIGETSLTEVYNLAKEIFGTLVGKSQPSPLPHCEWVEKQDLLNTLYPYSIEKYLYTRTYLDTAIDAASDQLINWLVKNKAKPADSETDSNRIRAFFLRTTRPDVNYFLPVLTANMRKAIYGTLGNNRQAFQYAASGLFNDYKQYYHHLNPYRFSPYEFSGQYADKVDELTKNLNIANDSSREDRFKNLNKRLEDIELISQLSGIMVSSELKKHREDVRKTKYVPAITRFNRRLLEDVYSSICPKHRPVWSELLNKERIDQLLGLLRIDHLESKLEVYNKVRDLKKSFSEFLFQKEEDFKGAEKYTRSCDSDKAVLTLFACSLAESSPLVAGIAYTTGKRLSPYVCAGWRKQDDTNHPFNIISKPAEAAIRYPTFMEKFFDEYILNPTDFPITINIPVVLNGLLFGVYCIYPIVNKKNDDIIAFYKDNVQTYLEGLRKELDKLVVNMERSFFLDVCNNVTYKLSGAYGEKDKSIDIYRWKTLVIDEAEQLLRISHVTPRTFIIDLSGDKSLDNVTHRLKKEFENNKSIDCEFSREVSDLLSAESQGYHYFKQDFGPYRSFPYENRYASRHFIGCRYIRIDKDWKFLILQIHEKPEENMNAEEKSNHLYLCQAIDTGLSSLYRQSVIIEKSSKAAMTAIMSRNLSHNIGSHVLSYWKNQLTDLLVPEDNQYGNDHSKLDNLKGLDEVLSLKNWMAQVRSSKDLLEYIQHRMDFLAEFTTSTPGSELSLDIETDVLFPVLYSKFSALLKYIAHSEGIDLRNKIIIDVKDPKNKRVSIPNGLVGIHALYSILENFIRNAAKHYKGTTYCLKEGVTHAKASGYCKEAINSINIYLTHIKEFLALNNGDTNKCGEKVGGDSFYGKQRCKDIQEKLSELSQAISNGDVNNLQDIENVKKHVGELHELQNEIPFIYICIDAPSHEKKWRDDFLSMTIWDMREMSCNYEVVQKLGGYLPEGKDYKFITDAQGELALGAWGIKEMLMSANFLLKNKPEMLLKDAVIKEDKAPKLLEIMCDNKGGNQVCCRINTAHAETVCCHDNIYKNKFGVRFYLKKPKDLAIVGDSLRELQSKVNAHKNETNKVFEIEYFSDDAIKDMDEVPHKILLVANGEKDNFKNKAFAPCRIMEMEYLHNNFQGINIDDDYFLCLYKKYVDKNIFKDKLHEHKLVCAWAGNEFPKNSENSPYTTNSLEQSGRAIVFFNHPEKSFEGFKKAYNSNNCSYVQPISGSYSTKAKLMSWKTLNAINITLRDHFFLELLEAAFTKIVIVDERVSHWADGVFLNNLNRRDILNKMKIFVPDIDLINCSYERIKEELEKKGEYNILNGSSGVHFFIIHQGVLDKMGKDFSAKLLNEVKCDWKVVDSGRGVPKEFKEDAYEGVRFIEISTLLKMIENYDKHGIVQTLFALRRPRGDYKNEEVQNA